MRVFGARFFPALLSDFLNPKHKIYADLKLMHLILIICDTRFCSNNSSGYSSLLSLLLISFLTFCFCNSSFPAAAAPAYKLPQDLEADLEKLESEVKEANYQEAVNRSKLLEQKYPKHSVHFKAQRALALMYLDRQEEAEAESKAVIKMDPGNYYGHFVLACLLSLQGNSVESSRHYELATKNKPERNCALCRKSEREKSLKKN